MVSPSFPYSCPPPPYNSHPLPTASAAPAVPSGLISPPESRRTSGDDAAPILPTRQSLPSIHEALGGSDPALSYPPQTSVPPATTSSAYYQSPAATSMADLHRRSFTTAPPPQQPESHHSFSQPPSHNVSPYMSRPAQMHSTPHTPTTTADLLSRPPVYAAQQHPKLPTLQPIRTGNSPVSSLRPNLAYPSQPSQAPYDRAPNSAPAQGQFGYSPFPPSQQFTFGQTPTSRPEQTYATASILSAPPRYPPPPPAWRSDNDVREPPTGQYPAAMVTSVKRHLDHFDLEASLNEVCLW